MEKLNFVYCNFRLFLTCINNNEQTWKEYTIAFIFVLTSALQTFVLNEYYLIMTKVTSAVKVSLMSAIYKKVITVIWRWFDSFVWKKSFLGRKEFGFINWMFLVLSRNDKFLRYTPRFSQIFLWSMLPFDMLKRLVSQSNRPRFWYRRPLFIFYINILVDESYQNVDESYQKCWWVIPKILMSHTKNVWWSYYKYWLVI